MKKTYISPLTAVFVIETQGVIAASKLDSSSDNPVVTPTDEEYNGEFSSRRRHNMWDDEEEENF